MGRRVQTTPIGDYQVRRFLSPSLARYGVQAVRRWGLTSSSRQCLAYWKTKSEDPTFHAERWGGFRGSRLTSVTIALIAILLWATLHTNPLTSMREMLFLLNEEPFCLGVSYWWLKNMFHSWRFTWKRPSISQLVKTPFSNIFCGSHLSFISEGEVLTKKYHQVRELSGLGSPD